MKVNLQLVTKVFCFLLVMVLVTEPGLLATGPGNSEVKVDTGLWKINLNPTFSTKAMSVTFNHPNTGTKKVPSDSQVLAVKIAIWNKGKKKIGVRRMDFFVNDQAINYFLVKEKGFPNVIYVNPGKGVYFISYYIVKKTVKELKDIKLVYHGIDENYVKKKLLIPVVVKKKK